MTWNGATCEWCDGSACTVCNKQRNMGRRRRMKEYIVHAPKDNPCAVEKYTSFYGEPIIELVRCKDCKYQKKEYHVASGRKDGGYYVRGYYVYWCEKAGEYSPLGFDNQYCSEAKKKEDVND